MHATSLTKRLVHDHNQQGILESLLTMKCFSNNTFQQSVKLLSFTFEALARSEDISLRIHAPHLSTDLYQLETDYCNSLLVNLPACSLHKLQRVLNTAARIVSLRPKRDDIIQVLISIHWLPVGHRNYYKFIPFAFRCLHNLAPSYLSELLKLYAPERDLQLSDKVFLDYSIPSTKYGERAFSVSGSVLWNSLPDDIRLMDDIGSFKSKLKTWSFKDAYKEHL